MASLPGADRQGARLGPDQGSVQGFLEGLGRRRWRRSRRLRAGFLHEARGQGPVAWPRRRSPGRFLEPVFEGLDHDGLFGLGHRDHPGAEDVPALAGEGVGETP
ncbi:MAG: hypothetical protein MZV65_16305 [Chromatiales bacterium]|nr:hypothetical protein [Chromatiales bacterium]